MIAASVTAIQESHITFCGSLRGDVIISTLRGSTKWRAQVCGGRLISGPDVFKMTRGRSLVEDKHGNINYPRLIKPPVDVIQRICQACTKSDGGRAVATYTSPCGCVNFVYWQL